MATGSAGRPFRMLHSGEYMCNGKRSANKWNATRSETPATGNNFHQGGGCNFENASICLEPLLTVSQSSGAKYVFAIKFGVKLKKGNTLKLGMGGSLTLIMLSLTPPAVTTTIKVKEAS